MTHRTRPETDERQVIHFAEAGIALGLLAVLLLAWLWIA